MKLNKVLCLFLMLAVVFSFASCELLEKLPIDLPFISGTEYTVTFNTDGGSEVAAQTVAENELATAPADPTKEGYSFIGWFVGDAEWSFETPITEDVTLVAKWEKLPDPCTHADKNDDGKCDNCGESFTDAKDVFSITYMDGTTKLNLSPATYTAESTGLKLPTPAAKDHYTFAGWYSDAKLSTKVTSINTKANKDLTYYAGYTPVEYTITYELDGGINSSSNPATYTIESLPTQLANATKQGFVFKGWFTDEACTVAFSGVNSESIANLVVYAKWEKLQYTVSYYVNNELVYTEGFTEEDGLAELYDASKPGYSFNGWFSSPNLTGATVTSIAAGTKKNVSLFGMYTIETYSVKFYSGTTLLDFELKTYQISDTDIELPAVPEKDGATVLGWYTADGVEFTSIKAGTVGNLVLYATYKSFSYTITYNLNGGENSEKNVAEYNYGTTPELYDPLSRDGYLFCGWYTDAEFTGDPIEDLTSFSNEDIVLYAKWIEYTDDESGNLTPEVPF